MKDTTNKLQVAADRLWQGETDMVPVDPIRDLVTPGDIQAAYEIQKINHARRLENGAHLTGRKIGLTSKAVQQQQGVFEPDFGSLYSDMELGHNSELSVANCLIPRVEMEIGFVIGQDLSAEQVSMADLIRGIDGVTASLEIVESRIKNWDISIVDTVADNAAAGKYVYGSRYVQLQNIELADCKAVLKCNGQVVGQGTGAASLGHPLNAVLWLARTLAAQGEPLKAGDFILSGALTAMIEPKAGERFEAEIDGLGTSAITFTE